MAWRDVGLVCSFWCTIWLFPFHRSTTASRHRHQIIEVHLFLVVAVICHSYQRMIISVVAATWWWWCCVWSCFANFVWQQLCSVTSFVTRGREFELRSNSTSKWWIFTAAPFHYYSLIDSNKPRETDWYQQQKRWTLVSALWRPLLQYVTVSPRPGPSTTVFLFALNVCAVYFDYFLIVKSSSLMYLMTVLIMPWN